MSKKIALLSNVNMNYVIRLLKKEHQIYEAEGYGNELGILMNEQSSYYAFAPEITFLIIDLMELLGHELYLPGEQGQPAGEASPAVQGMPDRLRSWLEAMDVCIRPGQVYYLSDAWLWGPEIHALPEPYIREELENRWLEGLKWLQQRHENVRIFPYRQIIGALGEENSFSLKMWYMGKILHTNEAQKRLAQQMTALAETEERIPKKVLLVDLDNTLWGGLAGERDHRPLELSEDHQGLTYKNAQRVIKLIEQSGAVLGIVSKNNEEDAMAVIRQHPHMVLRETDFAIWRINWSPKHENIREIATALNLGLDSMVFWDDSPAERELVKRMLPEVEVPDFPDRPEDLAAALVEIYERYFKKPRLTAEDREKTRQYAENEQRSRLESQTGDYEEYLRRLQIRIQPVNPAGHMERLVQLVNKTNQFNLTTIRYGQEEMQKTVEDSSKKVYLYRVEDCFGDYGIVSAVIVDLTQETPVIEEWVLSCRVMGRGVEDALLERIETELLQEGYNRLRGRYVPTAKNKPVAELYDRLGYHIIRQENDGEKLYEIGLEERPDRSCYVEWMESERY